MLKGKERSLGLTHYVLMRKVIRHPPVTPYLASRFVASPNDNIGQHNQNWKGPGVTKIGGMFMFTFTDPQNSPFFIYILPSSFH